MRTTAAALILGAALVVGCSGDDDGGDIAAIDAADFVTLFQDAGLPIGDFVVYDEDTDPNGALGQPGKYVGKASWVDDRSGEPCLDGEPGWECGGTAEVFESEGDRDSRFDLMSEVADDPLIGGFYMWKTENAVVRVGHALTPEGATAATKVIKSAATTRKAARFIRRP